MVAPWVMLWVKNLPKRLILHWKIKAPLSVFAATGGARMQEALISLMQMAKTSAVLERLKAAGIPYISVMTDPVYGGCIRQSGYAG